MATIYKSSQIEFASATTATLVTAVAQTIVNSVRLDEYTGAVTLKVKKGAATAVSFLKASGNGELLKAPLVLEAGDYLQCTTTARGPILTTSYVYNSESPAGQSIGVLTDVDITGIADGEVLVWNATGNTFEPGTAGTGSGTVTSVNGEAPDALGDVTIDATHIDYATGTTVKVKITDNYNAIVAIQDILKSPTGKVEVTKDANNLLTIDATSGSEKQVMTVAGVDAMTVTATETGVKGLNVNDAYTLPTANSAARGGYFLQDAAGTGTWAKVQPSQLDGDVVYTLNGEAGAVTLEAGDFVTLTTTTGNVKIDVDNPRTITEAVKNVSGGTLAKGTPVHVTGYTGQTAEVIAARADTASTMPATFILNEELANNAEGQALAFGWIQGVNTSGLTAGNPVWVGATGGWTQTRPTGSNIAQPLGIVVRVDASNGSGVVFGAGEDNTLKLPNVPTGFGWVGDANGHPEAVKLALGAQYEIDEFEQARNLPIGGAGITADRIHDVMDESVVGANNANAINLLAFWDGSQMHLQGVIDAGAAITGATAGAPLYLGTAGAFSATPPTTTGYISRVVGHYMGTLVGGEVMVMFNPSPSWVEID